MPSVVAPSEHVVVSPAVVAAPAKVVVLALVLTLVAARRGGPVREEDTENLTPMSPKHSS